MLYCTIKFPSLLSDLVRSVTCSSWLLTPVHEHCVVCTFRSHLDGMYVTGPHLKNRDDTKYYTLHNALKDIYTGAIVLLHMVRLSTSC